MKNALIIDGHNYLFKGFYGVPTQAKRPEGTMVNAVYGFFSLLRNIATYLNPDYLVVTFDAETSINNKLVVNPEYKAQRLAVHDDVYSQLPIIKACLDILEIQWVDDSENEADDLIGAYATKFNEKGINVNIGSNDFDFIQLVTDYTFLLRTFHGTVTKFDRETVINRFGINPEQYIEYLALKGDSSDNIKGVEGIGSKRATLLLSNFGNIPNMYSLFDTLPQGLQKLLLDKEEYLNNQKEFLRINTNTSLCSSRPPHAYLYSTDLIPTKMGTFLNSNWDIVVDYAQRYR